jgi:hypothetical protein
MGFFDKKPEDLTGLASFFDFLCAVFSRIAYTEDPIPLFLISGVFRIIPKDLLVPLSKITNISQLNQDEDILFNLSSPNNTIPIRTYNGKKYVNFIGYAEKINTLIEDTQTSPYYKKETDPNIKIISVADSNYGNVLVIGLKYIPNFIFTSFRGTYSTKTAGSYIQLSSRNPVEIEKGVKVLKGIAKIEFEILHSILAANNYIVTTFLKINNVIPVFTGHSLGGALATLLDLEYCNIITKKGLNVFSPLLPKSVCISFGSPRVLSKTTSETLCSKLVSSQTLLHRYSNDGDPVTSLPPPGFGFYHPCSSDNDKAKDYRKFVSRDCKSSTIMRPLPKSEYTKAINCTDKEPTMGTKLLNAVPNIADHMTYLYVSFAKAADIAHLFGKSAFTIETTEISRVKNTNPQLNITQGDTEMRIVQMTGNGNVGEYTSDFIDLVKLRKKGDTILNEDSLMSNKIFSDILNLKQDKVTVSFKPDGQPTPFSKSVRDDLIESVNQNNLVDSSFAENPIQSGGKRRSIRRRSIRRRTIRRRSIRKKTIRRRRMTTSSYI